MVSDMIDMILFHQRNKALLACLAKTLGVSLKRDLSESIIPKYLPRGELYTKNWELQLSGFVKDHYFSFFNTDRYVPITTEFLQST